MLKEKLDELVYKYETSDFIKNDPVKFCHIFKEKKDIEIAGFISSTFAFGRRQIFIPKLENLFSIMKFQPYQFLKEVDFEKIDFSSASYRFIKAESILDFLKILKKIYLEYEDLESYFSFEISGFEKEKKFEKIHFMFKKISKRFYSSSNDPGLRYMIADASKFGACKRLNMFLRWMVRKSAVDVGIWSFVSKSDLLIPLDTHVGRISRQLKLLERKSNDYFSVLSLTSKLKQFDPYDPVKYDFALFGFGVSEDSKANPLSV